MVERGGPAVLDPLAVGDGLNPDDPGILMLAAAVAEADPREILLVATGPVPRLGSSATRLVIDVRELSDPGTQPLSLDPGAGPHDRMHALVWPRAHLGKDFTFACLARGALALREGGSLWCAVRKQKGADSIASFCERLLGHVDVVARDRGYRLLHARRGPGFDRAHAEATLRIRHEVSDPLLGDLVLDSAPGVFSRRELDAGTRCLIEHLVAHPPDRAPTHVLDLGAGIGPLALWAARRWPDARVLAVEANLVAAAACEANVRRHGLTSRVTVVTAAGLPDPPGALAPFCGAIDLALANPPTHAPAPVLGAFVADALRWLAKNGQAAFVVSRAGSLAAPLRHAGAIAKSRPYARYTVIEATRPC